ncbi:family 2 glycosyl transferase [Cyclobacterium sp. 1_MG-2023]|uniref:glycosyltransferase n=1 Tax=Cyclobacterium sp. 1_MG-2023 TaxID=3062681 RepID=UPI0026E1B3DD|nr:family 2 glycosyl transferase [Cyclobacterium sp. 1_MG-2023]MDO6435819.1 family 2 glycosyl transferase [Cyclobacterium sp. 1_MG-2023]
MSQDIAKISANYKHRFNVNDPYFDESPAEELSLIIVIPSYKEPDISYTLSSLSQCIAPKGMVELIVVINAPENASSDVLEMNRHTISQIRSREKQLVENRISLKLIQEENLPKKFAGAGLARKIGMDEALQRWTLAKKDGPIVCLDADCTVSKDYLIAAEKAFSNPLTKLAHYQFKHLFLQEKDENLINGIVQYELHLRYHIQGLKWAGYPNAMHTVGSCMAVRASAYAKSGGMNRRKAGEDFYFMHKLLPVCQFTYLPAFVYPSCRSSDRVPFGTGRAQLEFLDAGAQVRNTYHPETYASLKQFFELVPSLYHTDEGLEELPDHLHKFLLEQGFENRLKDIISQSKTANIFAKNFWQWMDGFMVLKMTHFLRDNSYPEIPIDMACNFLLRKLEESYPPLSLTELLERYQQFDFRDYSRGLTTNDT